MMDHSRVVFNLREGIGISQDVSKVMHSVWFGKKKILDGSDMFVELDESLHLLICLNSGSFLSQDYPFLMR